MTPLGRGSSGEGQACALLVTPTVLWVGAEHEHHHVRVCAPDDLVWSAAFRSGEGAWASFTGSSSGVGAACVSLNIAQNEGAPRSGRIEIAFGEETREISVIQLAPPFWYEGLILSMKLPVLEERALLGMIKKINEAPLPARPSMFAALYEGIAALAPSILAIYEGFPEVPQAYTSSFVSHEIGQALAYISGQLKSP